MASAMTITVASPAKVNLYLRIGPRRMDGFHTLLSWFCSLGLSDQLRFDWDSSGEVRLNCDHPQVPCDNRNLILKAAELLRPHARNLTGARIFLGKRIP